MITPHQSQFTAFGDAFVSERHEAVGHEAPKSNITSLWRWTAALMVIAAVLAVLTVLNYQLAHYGSLPIEPAKTDGFLIVDPARM